MKPISFLSLSLLILPHSPFNQLEPSKTPSRNALALLHPLHPGPTGLVSFSQTHPYSETKILGSFKGLPPNGSFGLHIHEFGDLRDPKVTMGTHYNPDKGIHGDILDQERHMGDLGNVHSDSEGFGYFVNNDKKISLFGNKSIIGRGCGIDGGEDRGKDNREICGMLAVGVIGLTEEFQNIKSFI